VCMRSNSFLRCVNHVPCITHVGFIYIQSSAHPVYACKQLLEVCLDYA
jgi:hypothetical protein